MPEIDLTLQTLQEAVTEETDDEADAVTGVPVCQLGDLWELGEHRLHCGDATSEAAFDIQMKEQLAHVVFIDPPYNVRVDGHVSGNGKIRHREFAQASGELSREEFIR